MSEKNQKISDVSWKISDVFEFFFDGSEEKALRFCL